MQTDNKQKKTGKQQRSVSRQLSKVYTKHTEIYREMLSANNKNTDNREPNCHN